MVASSSSVGRAQLTLVSVRAARPCVHVQAEKGQSRCVGVQETALAKRGQIATGVGLSWVLAAGTAVAKDREYGILEGTTLALVHPAVMLGLFAATVYAGWLGWQWRRLRETGNEIRELKKQLPAPDAEGTQPPSPIADQIETLEAVGLPRQPLTGWSVGVLQTRKELAAGGFRDRHWNYGSVLLGGGIFTAVFGAVNTFLRTDKLFPGPHLYSGATIVVLWALAASLVPAMQKGNDNARTLHITLNALNVLLFASQIPTGFEIVEKVFANTSFP